MLNIKVLGSGYANCKKLEALVVEVVDSLGISADIEKVTDMAGITSYAIMSTPGLVVNEKVVSAGRIPAKSEIEKWIKEVA
ncbi:MAG: thioredoxin family protein [Chloroflexi bacterium]|nr:thioredoxin family protein [Chloroflexota bacterium]